MNACVCSALAPIDTLPVDVLVDVVNEVPLLMKNGTLKQAAGEYRCCAHHGLSLVITAVRDGVRRTLGRLRRGHHSGHHRRSALFRFEIVPAHCTGWRAVNSLARVFGDHVIVPSAVRRRFHF